MTMRKKQVIAGIDIGTSKIATIISSVDEEGRLSVIGVSKTKSQGMRKGQIVDIEEATRSVVESLEAAERMAGYQISSCFVSVGGTHISSQNSHGVVAVADPNREITQNDVARVIEAAKAVSLAPAREIIHVLPRYFTVDSQEGIKDPIGMSGVRLEVDTHLVTGGTTSLKNLEKCIMQVGIDVDGFVFNGLASAESVLTDTEKELGVVLLDLGAGTTDMAIYLDGALSYSSVLPVGARNVTNDLAIGLRISLESAEKIKIFLSKKEKKVTKPQIEEITDLEKKEEKKNKDELDISSLHLPEELKTVSQKTLVEGIIKPRLNEIFDLVSLEIKKSGFGGMTPSGVVITGGGAKTIGIIDSARRVLAVPIRIGYPYNIKGVTDEVISSSFATAVGLAKYGSKSEPKTGGFNLWKIPQSIKISPIKGTAGKLVDLVKSFLP